MTAWSKLLIATTRLIDLHDSGHEPGSPFVQVSQEGRRGLNDGYWLDLGCLLLDYLLDVDFATNSAFVSQIRCLEQLREVYPTLSHDDLSFVINLLATPSELHFRQTPPASAVPTAGSAESGAVGRVARSTKLTALIEKQSQTGQVRLTTSGRQAVTLASQVEDLLYSEYDAAKVLAALARGDFARVPDITNQILLAIRGLTQELRRVRENPTREGKLAALLDNQRHYHNALSSIQRTLLDARTQLTTARLMERFANWREAELENSGEEWDLRMLSSAIGRVLTAIENLSRRLAELLADIAEGRIQSMGVVDFAGLARGMLGAPPALAALQQALVARLMPLHAQVALPRLAPLIPLLETRRAEASHVALVFDEHHDAAPQDPLLARFLEARGAALRERIQRKPLSLPAALAEGWHRFEDGDCLAQLLNTFVDTELLDARLAVGIEAEPFEVSLDDGRRLYGAVTPSLRLSVKDELQ